ncbi:TPA: hypothetical protein ACFNMX_002145, partial [Neisseria lactamica]
SYLPKYCHVDAKGASIHLIGDPRYACYGLYLFKAGTLSSKSQEIIVIIFAWFKYSKKLLILLIHSSISY